jgi:hypothetical protein
LGEDFAGGVDRLPSTRQGDGKFFAATPLAFWLGRSEACSPIQSHNFSGADGTRSSCLLPQYQRSCSAPAMFSLEAGGAALRNIAGTELWHNRRNMKHDKEMESRRPGEEHAVTSGQNGALQKRKTIFIKLHPKPYAPRNSAVLRRRLLGST